MGEAPSSNIQTPEKLQISNLPTRLGRLLQLDVWCFSGAWSLEFGAFRSNREACQKMRSPVCFRSFHEVMLDRVAGQFRVSFHPHFFQNAPPVGVDGLDAD